MKKICTILACVIVAITGILVPTIVTAYGNDTVTAEATEEVVTTSIVTTTTEATTELVEDTTVVETTVTTTKKATTTKPSTTKQESKTTTKSSKSTTETTTEKKKEDKNYYDGIELKYSAPYNITSNKLTKRGGVAYYNGHKETWYSQKVLPGGGLKIPGRHVADDGTIRDENGYICVAADPSYLSRHSRVMTSLGPAKVYDSGCAYGIIDIYTNW